MRRPELALCLSLLLCAVAAVPEAHEADEVALPEFGGLDPADLGALLDRIVVAYVVVLNCPGHEVTDGGFALLNGSAIRLAGAIGLSLEDAETLYYDPAFARLEDPEFCAVNGEGVARTIGILKSLGGSTEPVAR